MLYAATVARKLVMLACRNRTGVSGDAMTGRWTRSILERGGWSRRKFLKMSGAVVVGAAGVAISGCGSVDPAAPSWAATEAAQVTARVTAVPTGKLVVCSNSDPAKAVDKALDAHGGLSGIVKSGDRVYVKANFSWAKPAGQGACNHPDVLVRIMQRCKDAGAARVIAIDNTIDNGQLCLNRSGIKAALDSAGFSAVVLGGEGSFEERKIKCGSLSSVMVTKVLRDADVFISAPVVKSHGTTVMSAGLKNLMGIIYGRGEFHSPGPLDQCIVDLAGVMRPDLVIGDAYRVLKTGGPGGPGEVIHPNEVIVSDDPVAADTYAATLLGLKPEDVEHVRLAAAAGLGKADIAGMIRV